jgi:hypothetical protein
MTPTYDGTTPNKVTGLVAVGAALMYKVLGVKKNLNAGHERTISEDLADTFKHKFTFKGFEFDSESVKALDGLSDVCVIVEYKQKNTTGDGIFVGYGLQSGLHITADSRMANDANGTRSFELATKDQEGEPHSQYNILITSYAATKAALEALLV